MLRPELPALVLAPMDGITDAPMRAFMGQSGAFSYAVSEFIRVSTDPIPPRVFRRDVPEVEQDCLTSSGLPVQVQILGGHAERMAISAINAMRAGARSIDINFGCPAPTVNRNDGGATLLKYPDRIREVVRAVRDAVPLSIPVSAKLRLGWESIEDIHVNAAMAAEGGASWLTIHARTRAQGYAPPVFWRPIGQVYRALGIPVIANGDIWTLDDFRRCQDETGVRHFMIGRSALANPTLPVLIAQELGIFHGVLREQTWLELFQSLTLLIRKHCGERDDLGLMKLKQWMKLAHRHGDFPYFHELKAKESQAEFFGALRGLERVLVTSS
ncbi:MAG: tRNA dihydrouridine synthase [Fimbriimonas sp.]